MPSWELYWEGLWSKYATAPLAKYNSTWQEEQLQCSMHCSFTFFPCRRLKTTGRWIFPPITSSEKTASGLSQCSVCWVELDTAEERAFCNPVISLNIVSFLLFFLAIRVGYNFRLKWYVGHLVTPTWIRALLWRTDYTDSSSVYQRGWNGSLLIQSSSKTLPPQ